MTPFDPARTANVLLQNRRAREVLRTLPPGISPATGQPGAVRVISTLTWWSSPISTA